MDIEKLIKGLKAVRSLINESGGVYGLHLNGDNSPWGELEKGGWNEDWLFEFNEAEEEYNNQINRTQKAAPVI